MRPLNVLLLAIVVMPRAATAISSAPSTLKFGEVPVNTTKTKTFRLKIDPGLQLQGASGGGVNRPYSIGVSICSGGGVGPVTCKTDESFHPTQLGTFNTTLQVDECDGVGPCVDVYIPLQGRCGEFASGPSTVKFGGVPLNTTKTKAVGIKIDPGYHLASAAGGGINAPYTFDFGTCTRAVGQLSCMGNESFDPTALGTFNTTLTLSECPDVGGTCVALDIPVQGEGGEFASRPPTVKFGAVALNTTKTKAVGIKTDPGYHLGLAGGAGVNPPYTFDYGTCTRAVGQLSCTGKESFDPTALGTFNTTLTLYECPDVGGRCIALDIPLQGRSGV